MREEAFRTRIKNLGTMGIRPISDAISRYKRIEKRLNINFDNAYSKNDERSIISLLEYTAEDARMSQPAPSELGFEPGRTLKMDWSH